jgi:hypothetical protein
MTMRDAKKTRLGKKGWKVGTVQELLELPDEEAVVEIVSGMPEDSTYDERLEQLVFNRMVERGLADAHAGRVVSHEEMKRTIDPWRA